MEVNNPECQTKNIDSESKVEDVSEFIRREFDHSNFGDKRLDDRLEKIGHDFGSAPSKSIPEASGDWASTKAVYRFADNPKVNRMKILSSHQEKIRARLDSSSLDKILCVADTTHLTYPSPLSIEGLGDIGDSKTDVGGVLVHSSIGIDPSTGKTLGVLDQQVLIQDQNQDPTATYDTNGKDEPKELESKQEKWIRGAKRSIEELPENIQPIHVMDRGADDFNHFLDLNEDNVGYVIRANQNRSIKTTSGEKDYLLDWSKEMAEIGQTKIEIQQKKGRKAREADLSVQAGNCELLPPNSSDRTESVEVNVLRIGEIGKKDDAIEWVLVTTETIEDLDDALKVMDYYQLRWRIEEWHKVLKTGCKIEELKHQKWERIEVLLGIYSVIAWKVMELRNMARKESNSKLKEILTSNQIAILEEKFPKLKDKDEKEYAVAVAKIGGYLDRSSDPPPGWIVMWRGLKELQTMAEGYKLLSS